MTQPPAPSSQNSNGEVPHWITILIAIIPALATIIGAVWVAWTYLYEHVLEEKKLNQTRLIEAQKPFLDKKFSLFLHTTEVLASLTTKPHLHGEWETNWTEFWSLYIAELPLVESKDGPAITAMRNFADKLNTFHKEGGEPAYQQMKTAAAEVAKAMQAEIKNSWALK